MPLLSGKQNIGFNIKEMMNSGRPYRVARAAALNKAYGKPKKTKLTTPILGLSHKIKLGFTKLAKLK